MNLNYVNVENQLIDFLLKETDKIGIKKAVIGLSGGIDSAVSAFLTVKALGPGNVLCVMMPYRTSSKSSLEDAQKVVKHLGVTSKVVDISAPVDSYISSLNDEITGLRKGNIMARMRMIVLYDESARTGSLVVGTSNKTELYLGYSTIFGDSACAINPLGDLYKTQIFELARHLHVPAEIINKKPSADLWEGQTDEGEMGITYAEVDKLLYQKYEKKKSDDEIEKMGFSKVFIDKVNSMIAKNAFKRMPPVVPELILN